MHSTTTLLIDAARTLGIDHDCVDRQRQMYRFHAGTRQLHAIDWALSCNQWLGASIAASPPLQLDFLRGEGIPVVDARSFILDRAETATSLLLAHCARRYPVVVMSGNRPFSRASLLVVSNETELRHLAHTQSRTRRWHCNVLSIPCGPVYSALVGHGKVIDIVELSRVPVASGRTPAALGRPGADRANDGLSSPSAIWVAKAVEAEALSRVDTSTLPAATAALSLAFTSVNFCVENIEHEASRPLIFDVYEAPQMHWHCYLNAEKRLEPAQQFLRLHFDLNP